MDRFITKLITTITVTATVIDKRSGAETVQEVRLYGKFRTNADIKKGARERLPGGCLLKEIKDIKKSTNRYSMTLSEFIKNSEIIM